MSSASYFFLAEIATGKVAATVSKASIYQDLRFSKDSSRRLQGVKVAQWSGPSHPVVIARL